MDGCFGILILVLIVAAIGFAKAWLERKAPQHVPWAVKKIFTVRCTDDFFQPEEGGPKLPLKKISLSGPIVVPAANHPVRFHVRIQDVTDSAAKPYAVFCMISDLADENGIYMFGQDSRIPYEFSEVSDMTITTLPLFALLGPIQGQRRIEVIVAITPVHGFDPLFAGGTATFTFTQEMPGYVEVRERTKAQDQQIAVLALAMSASDGSVDQRENAVIRRFFTERYADLDDGKDRKKRTTQALQAALDQLRSGQEKPSQMITRLCEDLREGGDSTAAQVAYELCVEVVTADGAIKGREEKALQSIAKSLQLPDSFVREIRDRNLRLSMYEGGDEEQFIGMPPGLSDEQKREFLSKEYNTWRNRVTHKDPQVATEAALRLERITKLRRQLSDV